MSEDGRNEQANGVAVAATETAESAPVPVPDRPRTRRRNDIQGLRAVASLLVASFHIWFGTVSGGVDLFFVVGGFLLATSLVGELERTGGIRVGTYLKRLAGRLFPTAGLVLLVVAGVLLATQPLLSFDRSAGNIFAAATYWENWHLAADSTDYIAAGHAKSAVQHYWAMGVQLQATLVLLAVFVLVTKISRARPRPALVGVVGTLTVASFVYALIELRSSPSATYFNTGARLWEFGVGVLVALVAVRWAPVAPVWLRSVVASIGLALVLTAGLLPSEWLYPGPIAWWPVGGAVLILWGGMAGSIPGATALLESRPLVFIGNRSYGVYLWSWPVLKAYLSLFPARAADGVPVLDGVLLLAFLVLLSWLTGRLLASWNRWRKQPSRHSASAKAPGDRLPRAALLVPIVAVVAFVGVMIGPQVRRSAFDALVTSDRVADAATLSEAIDDSLAHPDAPDGRFLTGVDALGPEWTVDGCLSVQPDTKQKCRYGPAQPAHQIWVVGDSHVLSWAPGLRAALPADTSLQLMGMRLCPFTTGRPVAVALGEERAPECDAHNDWVLEEAALDPPDAVIMTYGSWWGELPDDRLPSGTDLAVGTAPLVQKLKNLGIQVVWLDSAPPSAHHEECMAATDGERARELCEGTIAPRNATRSSQLERDLADLGVRVVPTLPWFCDTQRLICPEVVAGIAVRADSGHISAAYSRYLSPLLSKKVITPLRSSS